MNCLNCKTELNFAENIIGSTTICKCTKVFIKKGYYTACGFIFVPIYKPYNVRFTISLDYEYDYISTAIVYNTNTFEAKIKAFKCDYNNFNSIQELSNFMKRKINSLIIK